MKTSRNHQLHRHRESKRRTSNPEKPPRCGHEMAASSGSRQIKHTTTTKNNKHTQKYTRKSPNTRRNIGAWLNDLHGSDNWEISSGGAAAAADEWFGAMRQVKSTLFLSFSLSRSLYLALVALYLPIKRSRGEDPYRWMLEYSDVGKCLMGYPAGRFKWGGSRSGVDQPQVPSFHVQFQYTTLHFWI